MKRSLLAAYVLVVHAALVVLLWRTSIPAAIGLAPARVHPHITDMREVLRWRDSTTMPGAAIFLGDSLTERLAVSSVEPDAVNFGIGRSRTDQLFIPDAVASARRIYLLTGTNDFMQNKHAGIERRLEKIAEQLPIDVPLVWTGIMHPDADAANAKIRRICASRAACTYVEPLRDPRAFVDGVHLSKEGYLQWIDSLRAAGSHQLAP